MSHPAAPALVALLADYAEAWKANDPAQLKAFWDADRPPAYLAEEIDTAFHDWAAVEAYWRAIQDLHADVALRFGEPALTDMAEGLIMGVFRMDWRIEFSDRPAMAGDNRVAALFRDTKDGWRLAAWIEAPLAPITYIRRLYEARA